MRGAWIGGAAALCLGLSLVFGGTGPLGRVLMGLGLPGLAAQVFDDPAWQGAALYRAGEYPAAAERFAQAGAALNLGNAQTQSGRYAAALEAYDIARQQGDARARANFDLVAAYYAGLALDPDVPIAWGSEREQSPTVEAAIARGNARAAGAGEGTTNSGALLGLPELESHGEQRVRKVFDDKFMVANRRWLQSLTDVPGDYLAARIRHERKRRARLGLSPPEAEDPQ